MTDDDGAEPDWTDPDHVTGAVWAQLEDLSLADKIAVIGDVFHELTAPNERVRRGAAVIAHYRLHFEDTSEDHGTILSDLLADLMHWAAATDDVDFDSRLDLAHYHYDEEGGEQQ